MRLTIHAFGRPAPQGSKERGPASQMLESSVYLPAWRRAVVLGAYRAYQAAGIEHDRLPLIPRSVPVVVEHCTFYVGPDQCRCEGTDEPLGAPDVDKLLRATLDALGGARRRTARLFADDSQVKGCRELWKKRADASGPTGALIVISDGRD
jgi:Holliday junction resolvase RusA-like endonuclease